MNKKIMATLCAVATVVSTIAPVMPVLADDIGGSTVYVDKVKYELELPTTAKQAFILDPEGLASSIVDGAWSDKTTTLAGAIIMDAEGMTAKNSSSIPVALETSLKVTGDAAVGDAEDTTKAETDPTVFFKATFSDAKADNGSLATLPSTANPVLTDSAAKFDTILPAATYAFTLAKGVDPKAEDFDKTDINNYEYKKTEKTESGVNIKLTGACAKDADWSDYVGDEAEKEVGIEVIFKFFDTKKSGDPATDVKDDAKEITSKASVKAYGNWSGSTLWIGKDSSNGFDAATVTVKVSENGKDYVAVDSSYNDAKWVSLTYANISAKIDTSREYYVQVTDGTNVYVYKQD